MYYTGCSVLRTEQDYYDLAMAYFEVRQGPGVAVPYIVNMGFVPAGSMQHGAYDVAGCMCCLRTLA